MTKNIPSLYDFNGHNIRVVTIDDAPWFVAADVCKALGLGNVSAALSNLTNGEVRNMHLANGRARPNKIITEAGTYDLVFHSRKPEAKTFRDWVTGTVLPAIRKDGGYIKGEEKVATGDMSEDELVLMAMDVMRRKIDRLAAERDAMHKELYHLTIAEYAALNHIYLTAAQKGKLSSTARKMTLDAGGEVSKSPRVVNVQGKLIDTAVNVYTRDILDKAAQKLAIFGTAKPRPVMQAA